jgi:hypothetical protein
MSTVAATRTRRKTSTSTPKPDRIDKAVLLVVTNSCRSDGDGSFTCRGENKTYQVSDSDCTCPDFTNRREYCKHMMACNAPAVVMLIGKIRASRSLMDLMKAGNEFNESNGTGPDFLIEQARTEYQNMRTLMFTQRAITSAQSPDVEPVEHVHPECPDCYGEFSCDLPGCVPEMVRQCQECHDNEVTAWYELANARMGVA